MYVHYHGSDVTFKQNSLIYMKSIAKIKLDDLESNLMVYRLNDAYK